MATSRKDLRKLHKKQLIHLCHQHQLPTNGNKAHLIHRLLHRDENDSHKQTSDEIASYKASKNGEDNMHLQLHAHRGEHHTWLLVTAYFNMCYWFMHRNNQYLPTDLTQFTAKFVGNPFMERTDRYICRRPPDYNLHGADDGKTVICLKADTSIQRGRRYQYSFQLKVVSGVWKDSMIGISTHPQNWKGNEYIFKAKRVSLRGTFYYVCSRGIVSNEAFKMKGEGYEYRMHRKRIAMQIGDVLTVNVDCSAMKLVFKVNAKTVKVLNNIVAADYYLVAQFGECDRETAFYLMSSNKDSEC